jgi:hypothetical protein
MQIGLDKISYCNWLGQNELMQNWLGQDELMQIGWDKMN